jgi:hypothetical protein
MFTVSSVSKIALIGAIVLGMGMPSVAEAGLKKKIKKILASPVGPIITGNPLPLNWKKSLSLTKPVVIKNGQSCQTLHLDSSYRDSPSTKMMLPGYPKLVQSITGTVHLGSGADVDSYRIVDSDVMYPATNTRPITYHPAQAGAPGLAIPTLAHDYIRFAMLRPNYQEWSSKSEGDDIDSLRKNHIAGDSRNAVNYLTMMLELRDWKTENSAPLAASGPYAATAIVEVCVA